STVAVIGAQDAPWRRDRSRIGVRADSCGRGRVYRDGDVHLGGSQQSVGFGSSVWFSGSSVRFSGRSRVVTVMSLAASFFSAVGFLTRIPVPRAPYAPEAIGRSTSLFPVVGAGVGLANVVVLWVVQRAMPPALAAPLIVLTGILLTGALHFDGLADMADGFGGGRTRDDVLRIMRDHHIGTYATIAVVMALVLQIAAISTLIERHSADQWLVVAPTGSRW